MAALLWLIAGVVLLAAEVVSGELVLLMLGVAALGTAGIAVLGAPLWVEVMVFAVLSGGLVVLARPALRRRLQAGAELRTNVDALLGAEATVESTVNARDGRVRIGGDVWSARALDETQVLETGRTVTVVEIAGAVAVVWAQP